MEGTSPALFSFSSFLLLLPTSFALDILKACLGSTTPSLSLQVSRSCVAWSMFDKTIWVKAICRRKKTKTTKKTQTDPISVQRDKDKGAQPPTCASHSHLQEEKAACLHTYILLARKKKKKSTSPLLHAFHALLYIQAEHCEFPGAAEPQPSASAVAISQDTCGFPHLPGGLVLAEHN